MNKNELLRAVRQLEEEYLGLLMVGGVSGWVEDLGVGGSFQVEPPPPRGPCCLPDGSCLVMTESDCGDFGGAWHPQ